MRFMIEIVADLPPNTTRNQTSAAIHKAMSIAYASALANANVEESTLLKGLLNKRETLTLKRLP